MAKRKQYVVANPRGIPEGIRILATDDAEFFEGDSVTKADMGTAWVSFVERGFIVEAD